MLIAFTMGISPFYEVPSDQPAISAKTWDATDKGVKLALILDSLGTPKHQGPNLAIYVTNTSNTTKGCIVDSGETGFQVYTLDANQKWQPLHDYNPTVVSMAAVIPITPGQTRCYIVDLSPTQFKLVKSHDTKCRIAIIDASTHERIEVESSPHRFTE